MVGRAKSPDSKEVRKAQMARFSYNGVPIHKLTPVTKIKDFRKQYKEIENRLEAMAQYCDENGLVMTPLHMMNCLGVTEQPYGVMLRGKARVAETSLNAEYSRTKTDEEVAFIKERAGLLQRWESVCNQNCLDAVAKDNQFGRTIYLSKAIFHNWDTPQNTGVVDSSIEIILGKANRIKVRQEQEAKAQAKARKTDEAW